MTILQNAFTAMQQGYRNSWLKYLLLGFSALGNLLNEPADPDRPISLLRFMNAYLNSPSFVRWIFASLIQDNTLKIAFDLATKIATHLQSLNLLNETNFNALARLESKDQLPLVIVCELDPDIAHPHMLESFTDLAGVNYLRIERRQGIILTLAEIERVDVDQFLIEAPNLEPINPFINREPINVFPFQRIIEGGNPNLPVHIQDLIGGLNDQRMEVIEQIMAQRNDLPGNVLADLLEQRINRHGMNPVVQHHDHPDEAVFNPRQSTHTTSVHQSVSESAIRLFKRYGASMDIDTQLLAIKGYVDTLADNPVNAAAKRAIRRITQPDFTFEDPTSEDPTSRVSILQLLSLAFIAIHDEDLREGTLEDALLQFVIGLYEMQRGNNLSATGQDLGEADHSICTSGTFNKIIEKLIGIHPDCNVLYITKEQASIKLQIVVRDEALKYLSSQVHAMTLDGFVLFMGQFESEGLDYLWPLIKDKVADRMFEEFHSLYRSRAAKDFSDFIDAGEYTDLGDTRELQRTLLTESERHHQRLFQECVGSSASFFSETHYLVAHRHDNEQMQHEYDKRFALVCK